MNDPQQFFDALWAVTAAWAYRQMITRHVIQLPLPNPNEMDPKGLALWQALVAARTKKSSSKNGPSSEGATHSGV